MVQSEVFVKKDSPKEPHGVRYAGVRSSHYGVEKTSERPWPGAEKWAEIMNIMANDYFPGATPTAIWIIGSLNQSVQGCNLEFAKPVGDTNDYEHITFNPSAKHGPHEDYLNYFDKNGIKVFLQVEPGFADVEILIDLVLNQYKHHPCVLGFGVDVEWYNGIEEDSGLPVTDEIAKRWEARVKSYNSSYRLFLKHYDRNWLGQKYRGDIVFVDDSQCFNSVDGSVIGPDGPYGWDVLGFLPAFKLFADHFYPNTVLFQIGYRSDRHWWSLLTPPVVQTLGERLAEQTRQGCGIIWVDFTLRDALVFGDIF